MSQEEHDIIIGRATREHAEAVRELAAVQAKVNWQAEIFERLANRLKEPDMLVVFDNERWPDDLYEAAGYRMSEYTFSTKEIDGASLKALCRELLEAKDKQARTASRMKSLIG
jgi:hypothetical protein